MKIPEHELKQLLELTDIEALVLETEKAQLGHIQCPFCQKEALSVNRKFRSYHCFSCGDGGNAIKWVMTRHHLPFVKAVEFLVEYGQRKLTSPPPPRPAS